ncbi:MAG: T9SS type A sorting domain-containing protein [Ignavibacteria bacterium]|nr:T9SS type A sorting domain-containing protein [Ignavibacteria bacterium]
MKQFYILTSIILTMIALKTSDAMAQPRWDWAKPLDGSGYVEARSISWSPFGNLFVSGVFNDTLNIGGQKIPSIGNYDIFTALMSDKGAFKNSNGVGGPDVDDNKSSAYDNKGNYYVCGNFVENVQVGISYFESKEPFVTDLFLAKFNKNGVQEWAWADGSVLNDDEVPMVAVDSLGSIYMAGSFGGIIEFGDKKVTSSGKLDVYVVKISSAGAITWLQRAGGIENDVVKSISVSPNGDRIYLTGTFMKTANFGGQSLQAFFSKPDFFIQCLNANGVTQWAKRFGNPEDDANIYATCDKDGKLLVTGEMKLTMTFDQTSLVANGQQESDMFVCRMAKDGTIELLKGFGGVFTEVGLGIVGDVRGGIFVTGYFTETGSFGGTVVSSVGGRDGFIAKITSAGILEWVRSFGGPYTDEGRAVAVSPDNIPFITGVFETEAYFGPITLKGEFFTKSFVASIECGPNTAVTPASPINICEGQDEEIIAVGGYPAYAWYVDKAEVAGATRNRFMLDNLSIGTHAVYVRIRDFYDCSQNSDTLTVVVRAGLAKPTIFKDNNNLVCSENNVTYQWYREGNKITAATEKVIPIVGEGLYRVLISDTTGCRRWSDNFLVGTTDVFEPGSNDHGISVYPNPVNDILTIAGLGNATVTILDVTGRTMYSSHNQSGSARITMTVVPGTYVVRVDQDGKSMMTLVAKF